MSEKGKGGRPTLFKPEYVGIARGAAEKFGATDQDLADIFGVDVHTIYNWQKAHPAFFQAVNEGKVDWDARVERSLCERAMGYKAPDTDIRVVNNEIVQTPVVKHYPPDTAAAIFWLHNRQRHRWKRNQPEGDDGTEIPERVPVVRQDASIPEPDE